MVVTFSPELCATFPELTQPPTPLPPANDQVYRGMYSEMHHAGRLSPDRDMIEYMRMVPKDPNVSPDAINGRYSLESRQPGFSDEAFLADHFDFPTPTNGEKIKYTAGKDLDQHCKEVLLGHLSVAVDGPITIGLPKPAIASGGRYSDGREGKGIFYYWDQAAIVDALDQLGMHDIATGIIENVRDQIVQYKRPPFNGNAPEYGGRSQPAVYARMVRRDVRMHGETAWKHHLPALLIEHAYLMENSTVEVPNGHELNVFSAEGYTHDDGSPRYRPESFPAVMKTITKLEEGLGRPATVDEIIWLCQQDHSGAGAGTDFAGWMCGDGKNLHTLRVTKRPSPFQQALMFELECGIAEGLEACGFEAEANSYKLMAYQRAQTVEETQYDEETNYYYPYDVETGLVRTPTLQDASFMLESGMVPPERAPGIFETVEEGMLTLGGLICSLYENDLSWDKNIWAYFQLSAAKAAWLHGLPIETVIGQRFTRNVQAGREEMGYTIERYAPAYEEDQLGKPGGGGEYRAPKRNFVWTDAVDVLLRSLAYRNEDERQAFLRRRAIAQGIGIIGVRRATVPGQADVPRQQATLLQ